MNVFSKIVQKYIVKRPILTKKEVKLCQEIPD